MPTIYIRSEGTTLATDSSYFTLRSKGKRIGKIPPTMIDRVIVEHGVDITRKALDRLGALGIPVTLLGREGDVQARVVAPWRADVRHRLGQIRASFDAELSLLLARRWVDAKLANSVSVLRRHLSNYSSKEISSAAREISNMRPKVAGATDLPTLLGHEGMASRVYFSVFGRMLRAPWAEFNGRNRRPPRDPVNAVLSYSYGLISHQLHACSESNGLDPYVGYLHGGDYRRPALALDLMEPFRPILGDRLALRTINLGIVREEHFHFPDGPQNGIRMVREARTEIIAGFYRWVGESDPDLAPGWPSPGGLLLAEVEKFAALAARDALDEFQPYLLEPAD